jgi:hypothetical protein
MTQSDLATRLNALFALWEGRAPAAIVKDLLSFAPTRHVISTASGIRFFTCCAVDTLLIAHLLDEDVDIETTPPGHAEPLRINDKELRVSRSAVIAIPVQHDDHQIRETFCPYANGFPDEDAYQQWAATAPVPTISGPIKDAFDITSVIADRLKNLAARVGQRASCCSNDTGRLNKRCTLATQRHARRSLRSLLVERLGLLCGRPRNEFGYDPFQRPILLALPPPPYPLALIICLSRFFGFYVDFFWSSEGFCLLHWTLNTFDGHSVSQRQAWELVNNKCL